MKRVMETEELTEVQRTPEMKGMRGTLEATGTMEIPERE